MRESFSGIVSSSCSGGKTVSGTVPVSEQAVTDSRGETRRAEIIFRSDRKTKTNLSENTGMSCILRYLRVY